MKYWKKLSDAQIKERAFDALQENVNYYEENILGVPASHLDGKVFQHNASFLKDAPYISTLIHNPNHIGCHTLGKSEPFFSGTQKIERELIEICAVDILNGEPSAHDGYVASGGTEANMQAVWIYRNLFIEKYGAEHSEICIICSADAHYSMPKAANVLNIGIRHISVENETREINSIILENELDKLQSEGKRFFIVVANMMTTMFGSVDNVDVYVDALKKRNSEFRVHIDGAYGGFFYPFSEEDNGLDFSNPNVTSITLDAHKMAQAPYGTGIFLVRKNYMQYASTKDASYVEGEDSTLIGSRSGANALAIWMILASYGPYGWQEKTFILLKRTDWLCGQLEEAKIEYFRHPKSNIVTIKSEYVSEETAKDFGLVPNNHHAPEWYKIVIMEHVIIEGLLPLIERLKNENEAK